MTETPARAPAAGTDLRPGTAWRYAARLQPMGVLVGTASLATAWAFGSRVNVTSQRTLLIALSTVGLSMVLADPARTVTAASVTPLWRQRLRPIVLGLGLAGTPWLIARSGAAALYEKTSFPVGWEFLQWTVIASSQLALGSMMSRRSGEASIGPGLIAALMWWVLTSAPRAHERLLEVGDHGWAWAALLAAFCSLLAATSIDPARPRSIRWIDRNTTCHD